MYYMFSYYYDYPADFDASACLLAFANLFFFFKPSFLGFWLTVQNSKFHIAGRIMWSVCFSTTRMRLRGLMLERHLWALLRWESVWQFLTLKNIFNEELLPNDMVHLVSGVIRESTSSFRYIVSGSLHEKMREKVHACVCRKTWRLWLPLWRRQKSRQNPYSKNAPCWEIGWRKRRILQNRSLSPYNLHQWGCFYAGSCLFWPLAE